MLQATRLAGNNLRAKQGEPHGDVGIGVRHPVSYTHLDVYKRQVFIIEKNGEAVLIESPCFFDNNEELTEYLKDMPVAGMLIAYHGAGGTFLPGVAKYATQNAIALSLIHIS